MDRMWSGDNGRPQVPLRERKVPVEPRDDGGKKTGVSASTVRGGFHPTWETLCYPYTLTGPGRDPRSWVLGHSDIVPLFGYTFRQLQANEPSASVRRSQGRQAFPLEMRLTSFASDALA